MKKYYIILTLLLWCGAVNAQIINFPDPVFKAKLSSASATNVVSTPYVIDTNHDGEIQLSEAQLVEAIFLENTNISSIEGIEYFTNLNMLIIRNSLITALPNISNCHLLQTLICTNDQISETVDLTGCSILTSVELQNNHISAINLGQCQETLINIDFSNNEVNQFEYHSNFPAFSFKADANPMTNLIISGNFNEFELSGTSLTNLDLSHVTFDSFFTPVNINNSQLTTLNIKNGQINDPIPMFGINTALQYICVDESELEIYQGYINNVNSDVLVNTYCSFTPGGNNYVLQGETRYDLLNDGCDNSDPHCPSLRFTITDGNSSATIISNALGDYQMAVGDGIHTVTPNTETTGYYNVFPASVQFNFPADASPAIHDFCITPNGSHPDAEVLLIPQGAARPGFDAQYKLLFKNKGTTVQSGNVTLVHENTVAFVNATQSVATQTGNSVSWSFANLQPFEQREIEVTMHVNTPTQTPPVNAGTVLGYIAAINTDLTDETPDDNNFFLHQTVVNSFDPNDKTCLEGQTISAEDIGNYVHYQIRFENTGTAAAQNIVVKDVIDTDKFDVSSLVPLDGSHDFYTRINGNAVEFIFENINLPFDDANNDGYIVFKIKTKPTLTVGDSFSNSASIYFDYNHPIVTEPAVTTISVLQAKDFTFEDAFAIFPNPANNELNIQNKSEFQIRSIDIYNMLGQLVLAVTNAETVSKIDVSQLKSGNYFIKISGGKGSSVAQFVKE